MLSPYTTLHALSADTNTLGTNVLQLANNVTTAMEQETTQHSAGAQDKQKTIISRPTAGPTTKKTTNTNTTANLPVGTDNSATGTPVSHTDHLTLQEDKEEAQCLGLTRSVT